MILHVVAAGILTSRCCCHARARRVRHGVRMRVLTEPPSSTLVPACFCSPPRHASTPPIKRFRHSQLSDPRHPNLLPAHSFSSTRRTFSLATSSGPTLPAPVASAWSTISKLPSSVSAVEPAADTVFSGSVAVVDGTFGSDEGVRVAGRGSDECVEMKVRIVLKYVG